MKSKMYLVLFFLFFLALVAQISGEDKLRVGIIGLDTSHSIAFAKLLNDPDAPPDLANCRVVAAYPHGSADIESSVSRIPRYTEEIQELGVEIVDSIQTLLEKVDVVLLETNDGRPHLQQALQVFKAGKRVFIDKPVAGSLTDTVAVFLAADKYGIPTFSLSSLFYIGGAKEVLDGQGGSVVGATTFSPSSLEKTHPDLFWYGIHGVQALFRIMGSGCDTVTRVHSPGTDVVVGKWKDGRIGSFRGIREGQRGYGGTVFGSEAITELGSYQGYRPLLVDIVHYFRTGEIPVTPEETLEVYAFMEAADESKRQGGRPVSISDVLEKAREKAEETISRLD